ncbi:oxidoreductase [Novosphingobium sp. G106]|uniref:oxidoreductase n=1 Tax=Novosphingobium sp. G106 TaxID=2849500 RepID=UPI001C2D18F5|nr:oxidoreductase [Novosphingobium sp. G106]MBV1691851.1 oxidoreductase [Novosphingobium sp. G106]
MTKASKQIGVGLIGYGLGGRVFHAPFIQATDGLTLRAVVSRDPAKVHSDLPDMAVVPSVVELLAQTGIDLVVVSSPDALHAEHAIAALRAGKHVVVDKPFATNLADARRIAETADLAGRMVTVFHNRRWDADFLTLQRLIAECRLGRIVHFESHFDRWRPEPGGVWKEAREGGSWLDLGPHLVDQALCLFGKPEAVTADIATMRDGAPAPDWFHAILHYPRMRAILHSSKLSADHRLRFSVYGTSGSWVKQGFDTQESAVLAGSAPGHRDLGCDPELGLFTQAGNRELPIANERGDYGLFWRRLVHALQENEPNPVPVDEALLVMEVLQAGLESAVSGSTVRL